MIITTTDTIPNKEILEIVGIARGAIILDLGSLGIFKDQQGEMRGHTKMQITSRETAIKRMIKHAEIFDADAIVGMRFVTTSVIHGVVEVLAYGTAVKLK